MEDTKKQAWKIYKPSHLNLAMTIHILNEAKTYLAFINENANRITQRAYTLLAILIAFLSVIYSFLWNSVLNANAYADEFWMLGLVLFPLIYPMVLLLRIIFPRMTYPTGRRPRDISVDIFTHIPFDDQKEKYFYLAEIKVYQISIEKTQVLNQTRIKSLRRAIYSLCAIALLFLLSLLLLSLCL